MLKIFDSCPKCGKGTVIADLSTLEHHTENGIKAICTRCGFKTTIPKPK